MNSWYAGGSSKWSGRNVLITLYNQVSISLACVSKIGYLGAMDVLKSRSYSAFRRNESNMTVSGYESLVVNISLG